MVDLASLSSGLALAKSGFDTLRTAVGLVKDAQGILPAGEKKDVVGRSLEEADRQIRLAEAQIARGLGYKLCQCEFPPAPMLLVGYQQRQGPRGLYHLDVHQCPKCCRTHPPGAYSVHGRLVVLSD